MVEMNLRLAEMYLRQMHSTQLTYSACGPFTTNKEGINTNIWRNRKFKYMHKKLTMPSMVSLIELLKIWLEE